VVKTVEEKSVNNAYQREHSFHVFYTHKNVLNMGIYIYEEFRCKSL